MIILAEIHSPYILDTSVVINQRILKLIEQGTLGPTPEILLSHIVLAEIEHQANQKKESGIMALTTLMELNRLEGEGVITTRTVGERPTLEQINLTGELDARIRMDAKNNNASLITSDIIQSQLAEVEKIPTLFVRHKKKETEENRPLVPHISEYFDPETLSVHLKEGCAPMAKRGVPGCWRLETIDDEIMNAQRLNELASQILGEAKEDTRSFIEIQEAAGATVVQLREYRIVICRPPFANALEITAVRPLVRLSIEDYALSDALLDRLHQAEGILVSGSPGAGKSTFVSALAELYLKDNKIVKTLESVRDLQVPPEVTQYSPIKGSMGRAEDILLLVRPDYTIYDEVRTTKDFMIYADMRLAGVGMVGVVHASSAIDAVQRFVSRVELGMIPGIIDTIIHMRDGLVEVVYSLQLRVKVPQGFKDPDLARPVVEVSNYETGEVEFELYTFGDNVVVSPAGGSASRRGQSSRQRQGTCEPGERARKQDGQEISFRTNVGKKNIVLATRAEHGQRMVAVYIGGNFAFNGAIGKDGIIKIGIKTQLGKRLTKAIYNNKNISGILE